MCNELLTVKPAADLDENRVSHFDSKILTHKSDKREQFTQSFNTCIMNC